MASLNMKLERNQQDGKAGSSTPVGFSLIFSDLGKGKDHLCIAGHCISISSVNKKRKRKEVAGKKRAWYSEKYKDYQMCCFLHNKERIGEERLKAVCNKNNHPQSPFLLDYKMLSHTLCHLIFLQKCYKDKCYLVDEETVSQR